MSSRAAGKRRDDSAAKKAGGRSKELRSAMKGASGSFLCKAVTFVEDVGVLEFNSKGCEGRMSIHLFCCGGDGVHLDFCDAKKDASRWVRPSSLSAKGGVRQPWHLKFFWDTNEVVEFNHPVQGTRKRFDCRW